MCATTSRALGSAAHDLATAIAAERTELADLFTGLTPEQWDTPSVCAGRRASFSRAAARLHLAQPGVSAQIRRLERELGQPLLDRSGRSVRVTEVGEAVLPYARAAPATVDGVRQTTAEFTGLLRGRVGIGLIPGVLGHEADVPGLLADFHDDHPRVEITLTEDTSDRMLAALRRGELDIAVVGVEDEESPPGLATRVFVDEPLVATASEGHPLFAAYGGAATVPVAALAEYPLISLVRGTGVRAVVDRLCAEAGFRPRIAFEAAAPDALARLAARGLRGSGSPCSPVRIRGSDCRPCGSTIPGRGAGSRRPGARRGRRGPRRGRCWCGCRRR